MISSVHAKVEANNSAAPQRLLFPSISKITSAAKALFKKPGDLFVPNKPEVPSLAVSVVVKTQAKPSVKLTISIPEVKKSEVKLIPVEPEVTLYLSAFESFKQEVCQWKLEVAKTLANHEVTEDEHDDLEPLREDDDITDLVAMLNKLEEAVVACPELPNHAGSSYSSQDWERYCQIRVLCELRESLEDRIAVVAPSRQMRITNPDTK